MKILQVDDTNMKYVDYHIFKNCEISFFINMIWITRNFYRSFYPFPYDFFQS